MLPRTILAMKLKAGTIAFRSDQKILWGHPTRMVAKPEGKHCPGALFSEQEFSTQSDFNTPGTIW